jgi:hypothetical protein
MSRVVLTPGPRRATITLWCLGAGLAAVTGLLSVARSEPVYGLVYGAVAAGLIVLAFATHRGVRVAHWLSIALLGSQIFGALGAAWELRRPDMGSAKARHLRDLGVNYRWALLANMLYSLVAGLVFIWAVRSMAASSSKTDASR